MQVQLISKRTQAQVEAVMKQFGLSDYHYYEPGQVFLCVLENNVLMGFADLYKLENVRLLYAAPSKQQADIFNVLLQAVERIGFRHIILNVSEVNMPFFQSFGYHRFEKGRMIKYLNDTAHFKTYDDVQDYINAQPARVYSLDHFKAFMNEHFNIQYTLRCVHIGGTNGKGSTVNYTKEVLKTAHYEVGTFTSPSLEKRLDIIQINDEAISEKVFVKLANRFMKAFTDAQLSKFEIEVFISVMYFIYKAVDIALYEVGLGGELDATNIIGPLLSVNTNIGLDHTDYLGDTYQDIARAKAGIIKDGVPFLTAETKPECLDVFYDACMLHHSELIMMEPVTDPHFEKDQITYDYHGYHITLYTGAHYQVNNSALAINILENINDIFPFTTHDLISGLAHARWPGRFEKVHDHPTVILDGAHNKEGMSEFVRSASAYDHPYVIFSALGDKDTHHMLLLLRQMTDDVVVTEFSHPPRSVSAEALAEDFDVTIDKDWHHAVNEALKLTNRTIFITGSLYFIALVRRYLLEKD